MFSWFTRVYLHHKILFKPTYVVSSLHLTQRLKTVFRIRPLPSGRSAHLQPRSVRLPAGPRVHQPLRKLSAGLQSSKWTVSNGQLVRPTYIYKQKWSLNVRAFNLSICKRLFTYIITQPRKMR